MISLYSKLIGALIFCVIFVSAQESLLTGKTSQPLNDHGANKIANLRGVNEISKYGNMTAVTIGSMYDNGKVPIDRTHPSFFSRNDQSIRTLTDGQNIVTIAGTGYSGYNGDAIAATSAQVSQTLGITVDGKGDIYFAEVGNNRIRKVTVSTGMISTIAGTGAGGYNGDGILATSAQLNIPADVAVDVSGDVYIADFFNSRIRKVTVSTGMITTIAGTGSDGYNGDGILATSAQLLYPQGIALDVSGDVYIADRFNNRIRKVTVSTGMITTIAGTGSIGYNGDGIMATDAQLKFPAALDLDVSGNIYIADSDNDRIRKVTVSTGIITTVAGAGSRGYNGDGIIAMSALLYFPSAIALDVSGNIYIADTLNHRIRIVTASTGIITTIAGTGSVGYNGDGIIATSAQLNNPQGIARDASGDVYISDQDNNRIRLLTSMTPTVSPTAAPSMTPTACPTAAPSMAPTACPTATPSMAPTACPTAAPSMAPTASPLCKERSPPSSAPSHDCATRKPTPKRNTPKPKPKRNTPKPTPKRNTPKPTPKRNTRKPSSRAAPRV